MSDIPPSLWLTNSAPLFYRLVIVLHTPQPKGVNELNAVFYAEVYVALLTSKNNWG